MRFQFFLTKFFAFFLGCSICQLLQLEIGLIPVAASALTGFLGSFLDFPRYYERQGLHGAIYAGSFAGMTSPSILLGFPHIVLISLIGTILYLWSRPFLNGYGGKLGTISFISALAMMFSRSLW